MYGFRVVKFDSTPIKIYYLSTKERKMPSTPRMALTSKYDQFVFENSIVYQADCFDWLQTARPESVQAVVTDPPYGVKEYTLDQLSKRRVGVGGTWRIPPSFDGHERSPLPRFTALNDKERATLKSFFVQWSELINRLLVPGGHVFVASNAFLSQLVFSSIIEGGLEFRGEVIRLVRTLRGGDRPKNAEKEYPDVCSMARGCYEPWGIFRKKIPKGMTVSDCLKKYQTGGLRRLPDGRPFSDVILSERTPEQEKRAANHPSLKPQAFLKQIVYASLPLGKGTVLDPFMGSGSTIAAAAALKYKSIGVESNKEFFRLAQKSIGKLKLISLEQVPFLGRPHPLDKSNSESFSDIHSA